MGRIGPKMSWIDQTGHVNRNLRGRFQVDEALEFTQENPRKQRPAGLCHKCASVLQYELHPEMECTHVSSKSGADANNRCCPDAAIVGNFHVTGTHVNHDDWQPSSKVIGAFTDEDSLGWLSSGDEGYTGHRGRQLPPHTGPTLRGVRPSESQLNAASATHLAGNHELSRASGFNQIHPGTERFHMSHHFLNQQHQNYPVSLSPAKVPGWNDYEDSMQ